MLYLPLLLLAAASPSPSDAFRSFGQWMSVCDNGARCEVSSEMGQVENFDVRMHLRREAGATAHPKIRFESPDSGGRFSLWVDGRSFPLFWNDSELTVPAGSGLRVARALAAAKAVALVGGGKTYLLPPQHMGTALRDMDVRQGRTDTVSAIVAVGPKPASAVPPAPALPIRIERKRPSRGLVIRPSAATLAKWRRAEDCNPDLPLDWPPPKSWPIDRRTAVIVVTCHSGAHNSDPIVRVGRKADGSDARDALFDFDFSMREESGPNAPPENPDRDPATGRLSSGANGGLVDPSTREEWVWDGHRFRLIAQSTSYGSTFRASVRRR